MPVLKEHIEELIRSLTFEFSRVANTTTTVCYAYLPSGFRIGHGDSACVNPDDYDYQKGCSYAKEQAIYNSRQNLWMVEGYRLHVSEQSKPTRKNPVSPTVSEVEGFYEYQGKPITRIAYEVKPTDEITSIKGCSDGGPSISSILVADCVYEFAHFEPVNPGDFVCFLDHDDIYHVRRSVMEQRNHL